MSTSPSVLSSKSTSPTYILFSSPKNFRRRVAIRRRASIMSVEILNGATIDGFVEDEEAFNSWVHDSFAALDEDQDGVLSYEEMLKELQCLRVFETDFGIDVKTDPDEVARVYCFLFLQFDRDSNGVLDFEEFKTATKRMMLAVADGLGLLPLQMILEEGSFLKKAVEWESTKLVP